MPDENLTSGIVSQEVVDYMLSPYKDICRYVKSASSREEYVADKRKLILEARLNVPCCFYAAMQGAGRAHFNATEFILAFNQMGCILISDLALRGKTPELDLRTLEDCRKMQIERILINRYDEILFKRALDSNDFTGRFTIENMKSARGTVFYPVTAEFSDPNGGYALGKSTICVVPSKKVASLTPFEVPGKAVAA